MIAFAVFSLASTAQAALVVRDDVDSADVTFTADPGEANRVVVREEPGGFRFVDTGSVLRTSTCTLVNVHEVFCPGIAETLIVEVGDGNDSYVLDAGARGIAATIADSGGDPRDSISLTCKGVRLTATGGTRERRGRYTLPNGTVTFAGLDGALSCALPRVVGMTLARARRALVAAGFRVGKVTHRRSAKVRRGNVISQRLLAQTVSLVVSSGRG